MRSAVDHQVVLRSSWTKIRFRRVRVNWPFLASQPTLLIAAVCSRQRVSVSLARALSARSQRASFWSWAAWPISPRASIPASVARTVASAARAVAPAARAGARAASSASGVGGRKRSASVCTRPPSPSTSTGEAEATGAHPSATPTAASRLRRRTARMVRSPARAPKRLQLLLQPEEAHLPAFNTARRAFVALLVALCPLALVACGGEDPQELINQTFQNTSDVRSGKIDVGLTINAQGSPQLSQPVTVKLTGPFQSQGQGKLPKFDFGVNINAAGQAYTAGATSTGTAGFVKVLGNAYELPPQLFASLQQNYARAQSSQNQGASLGSLGIEPRNWLVDPEVVGEEDVGGTATQHVSARIDVPKLLEDVNRAVAQARERNLPQAQSLPPSITPAQRQQVQEAIRNATFEFWTGSDDKVLRRLAIKIDFQVPAAERQGAGGVSGGRLAFAYQLSGLNQPQQVAAPANPQPFAELVQAGRGGLGALLGAAGGAGGAPGAAPGGTPPGFAPAPPPTSP